jgi:hypothetical protein
MRSIKKIKTIIPNIHNKLYNVSGLSRVTDFCTKLICIVELDVVKFSFLRLKPQETNLTLHRFVNGELL